MNKRLISIIARRGGGRLLDSAVKRLLSMVPAAADATEPAKRSVTGALAGAALTRIATRSVPGAIVVGGGMLAKLLYDRRRASKKAAKVVQTGKGQDARP